MNQWVSEIHNAHKPIFEFKSATFDLWMNVIFKFP